MPPAESQALTEDEKRTFVEWIDMGALWDGIPGPDNLPGKRINAENAENAEKKLKLKNSAGSASSAVKKYGGGSDK